MSIRSGGIPMMGRRMRVVAPRGGSSSFPVNLNMKMVVEPKLAKANVKYEITLLMTLNFQLDQTAYVQTKVANPDIVPRAKIAS
jgi:hypothetical protein